MRNGLQAALRADLNRYIFESIVYYLYISTIGYL
jgi:hypothetical protein